MSRNAKIIQLVLAVAILAAAVRLFLYFRERHDTFVAPKQQQVALDPDAYVTPRKLRPQDLKDAKDLSRQPVWVRAGYALVFYPYTGHADFQHPAGKLAPIEKLQITDVVLDKAPQSEGEKQVMAVFEKEEKRYAFPIGVESNGSYHIYSDDLLFIQDPHELYKHWSPDVWQAIDNHQVNQGMNELQASFAVGTGIPEGTGTSNPRVVHYANNGQPLTVTFDNGKATSIQQGS